jgi:desulfoferrodoxin (superoxide reductase-like protein)
MVVFVRAGSPRPDAGENKHTDDAKKTDCTEISCMGGFITHPYQMTDGHYHSW